MVQRGPPIKFNCFNRYFFMAAMVWLALPLNNYNVFEGKITPKWYRPAFRLLKIWCNWKLLLFVEVINNCFLIVQSVKNPQLDGVSVMDEGERLFSKNWTWATQKWLLRMAIKYKNTKTITKNGYVIQYTWWNLVHWSKMHIFTNFGVCCTFYLRDIEKKKYQNQFFLAEFFLFCGC